MPATLRSVLTRDDLPGAELAALVLDGELYRLGDSFAAIDQAPLPVVRAAALRLPPRLIAEQHTAAWVWGALAEPPARHEVCADTTARVRPAFDARLSVREVVLLHDDVVVLADTLVTSPMRTAIDLARFVVDWTETESQTVRALLMLGGHSVLDCARVMNRKRNLPKKRLALDRFAGCLVNAGER